MPVPDSKHSIIVTNYGLNCWQTGLVSWLDVDHTVRYRESTAGCREITRLSLGVACRPKIAGKGPDRRPVAGADYQGTGVDIDSVVQGPGTQPDVYLG